MKLNRKTSCEIRAAIVRNDRTQREVAAAAGLTEDRLSKMLAGVRDVRPGELTRVLGAILSLSTDAR